MANSNDVLAGLGGLGSGLLESYRIKQRQDLAREELLRRLEQGNAELQANQQYHEQSLGLQSRGLDLEAERNLGQQDYQNQTLDLNRAKTAPMGKKFNIRGVPIDATPENLSDILRYLSDEDSNRIKDQELQLRKDHPEMYGGSRKQPPTPPERRQKWELDFMQSPGITSLDPNEIDKYYKYYGGNMGRIDPEAFPDFATPTSSPEALAIQGAKTREEAQALLVEIKSKRPEVFRSLNAEMLDKLISQLPSTGKGVSQRGLMRGSPDSLQLGQPKY